MMQRDRVAVLRNPKSGTGRGARKLHELLDHLSRNGLRPRLFSRRERMQRTLERPEWRDRLVGIVAAGGDGTVSDVVNRCPGLPVAVLPLGTENLLARYLGVPRSGRGVAEMIAAGRTRRLDLGQIGDRRFVLVAGFGFDGEIAHRLHASRTGTISHWTYVRPIVQALFGYDFPEVTVSIDDDTEVLRGKWVVAANVPAYALGLLPAPAACPDDRLLDVVVFGRGSAFQIVRYFGNVALRRHEKLHDVYTVRCRRLRVTAERAVPVEVDGDPGGFTPADVSVLPQALTVFVPASGEEKRK